MSLTHQFVSAKADGPDATVVKPSNWNAAHAFAGGASGQKIVFDATVSPDSYSNQSPETTNLTNKTGGAAAAGDVVALSSANDDAVALDDTQTSKNKFCVALGTPADGAVGMYAVSGLVKSVKATGAIARYQFVRKSATTKTLEDSGTAANSTTSPPAGAIGISLTAAAGGVCDIFLFNETSGGGGAAGQAEFFGTGTDGAVTDNGGGTVIRNGILNATTYSLGTSVGTTLTHDISRSQHIKAQTSVTIGASGTVGLNSKGGAGASGAAAIGAEGGQGGPGLHGGGGGGGGGPLATPGGNGGQGGGLSGGAGGAADVTAIAAGRNGTTAQFIIDLGFAGRPVGPGGGGGGGGGGATSGGGAGGAGGGCCILETPAVTLTAGFSFTATGANGTNGATDGGGGGGGAGGTFIQIRRTLAGAFAATVTGGTGGTNGAGTGAAGGNGSAGQIKDEVIT